MCFLDVFSILKGKKKKRTEQKAFLLDRNYPSHDNIDILLSFFTLLAIPISTMDTCRSDACSI